VDFPGYGHAVAPRSERFNWQTMIEDYLKHRLILSHCFVLVDCTRGLCAQDRKFIKQFYKIISSKNQQQSRRIPPTCSIIATKADLFSIELLEASLQLIESDLKLLLQNRKRSSINLKEEEDQEVEEKEEEMEEQVEQEKSPQMILDVHPVSASTGAGINDLWKYMVSIVKRDTLAPSLELPSSSYSVREHKLALQLRNHSNTLIGKKKENQNLFKNSKLRLSKKSLRALK
jgi:glutaredoxin